MSKFVEYIIKIIKAGIKNYIEDVFILSGLFLIIKTTFYINKLAGLYLLGVILLLLGIYFARNPTKKER